MCAAIRAAAWATCPRLAKALCPPGGAVFRPSPAGCSIRGSHSQVSELMFLWLRGRRGVRGHGPWAKLRDPCRGGPTTSIEPHGLGPVASRDAFGPWLPAVPRSKVMFTNHFHAAVHSLRLWLALMALSRPSGETDKGSGGVGAPAALGWSFWVQSPTAGWRRPSRSCGLGPN